MFVPWLLRNTKHVWRIHKCYKNNIDLSKILEYSNNYDVRKAAQKVSPGFRRREIHDSFVL